MKKVKIVSIVIILSITIYCGLYFLQYKNIKNYQINYWFPSKGKVINDFKIIRCDATFFNPKFLFQNPRIAFISDQLVLGKYPELTIYFSEMKNTIIGKIEENYLGATDVKNTTFPELVKMVKEDCGQFQKGYLDYTGYENLSEQEKRERYWEIEGKNLGWTYTPYTPEPPEPVLTEEEKKQEEEWHKIRLQQTLEKRKKAKPIELLYE